MQSQIYRSPPKTGLIIPHFQQKLPNFPQPNIYSSPQYINKGPFKFNQQIQYTSSPQYYVNPIPQSFSKNFPSMPPILTDQQYKNIYVNKSKSSSVMIIPSQHPIRKKSNSYKRSILRQQNLKQKQLNESNFSHHSFDYTIEPQKIFCVICQKVYTLDRQKQHLSTHKNKLHNEDLHPVKNVQAKTIFKKLKMNNGSRLNLTGDNDIQYKKENKRGIIKPIVQPEQYNIQYNPNEFIVTKNVQYVTKQLPPPPQKIYESFGFGDDDIRPSQKVTKNINQPIIKIERPAQNKNTQKQDNSRVSKQIQAIPQNNQIQEQYERDIHNLLNTNEASNKDRDTMKTQLIERGFQNLLNTTNKIPESARNTLIDDLKEKTEQKDPIKIIEPIILQIFNNPNKPNIQTQEMNFDQTFSVTMKRRIRQTYQTIPKQEIVISKVGPLNQQKLLTPPQPLKQTYLTNESIKKQQNKEILQKYVNLSPNRSSQVKSKVNKNHLEVAQSIVNVTFSDQKNKQYVQHGSQPFIEDQHIKFTQPNGMKNSEIKITDIIKQINANAIKDQQSNKKIALRKTNSFFQQSTLKQVQQCKIIAQEKYQSPSQSKFLQNIDSQIINTKSLLPSSNIQSQGKKKKISKNIIW